MKHALVSMLRMQDRMNARVHERWVEQEFAWYRAIWIECGELMEHHGYKWWKKHEPDMQQVRLEIIDIWHFGLSALMHPGKAVEEVADEIEKQVAGYRPLGLDVLRATEALALDSLHSQGFSPTRFWELMLAAGLDFDALYSGYVGKNVLNFFRQDNGYQSGTYSKQWQGREDNEHLVELVSSLDINAADFAEQLYQALALRYQSAGSGN